MTFRVYPFHTMNEIALLRKQVNRFKLWASSYPEHQRSGEWECDYEHWPDLWSAALSVLQVVPASDWGIECSESLLYVLARDNEIEYIAEQLATRTDALFALARMSVESSEQDAKWQLAAQLGNQENHKSEAESILLLLVRDENEYVSRRALLALGNLKSEYAENLAERAWGTGHEYQRIAALWVLKDVSSSKLSEYVLLAERDGREFVVKNAREVQSMVLHP